LTGISYYFEFLRQLKVCYSKTETPNSADLFKVNVIKIGTKIQNIKKSPCLVFSDLTLTSRIAEHARLFIILKKSILLMFI